MQLLPLEVVAVGGAFLAVAIFVGLGASRLLLQAPERRRLREFGTAPVTSRLPGSTVPKVDFAPEAGWLPKSVREMSLSEKRLASAGYRTRSALTVFRVAQVASPTLLAIACLLWFGASRNGWVVAAFAAVAGFLLPGLFIDRRIAQRRKQIRNGLPDVLDLLIVCLEAGSSLDQSVVKASDELALAYPALAEELRVLSTETRAGKPRIEAFRNLAQRTKVDDVRALVAMLAQTDRFGTSVAQALRTLAADMRTRRRQSAEERANKVGVKLVFPLVLCLFPAFFVVVLGPAVLSIMKAFGNVGR